MYIVVSINGKQYKVSPGQKISVDKIDGKTDDIVTFDQVRLIEDNGKIQVGTPLVKNVRVKAKIISWLKEPKIDVRRYKAKVRFRKNKGFRAQKTMLEVVGIGRS